MVPAPIALGLTICEKVIVEQGTGNITLVGTFTKLHADEFPVLPLPFYVFATLTGAQGEANVTLTITRLETDGEVDSVTARVAFPDRFAETHVVFRFNEREFPAPGDYLFNLLVDGD